MAEEGKQENPSGGEQTGEGGEKLSKNQLKKLAKGKVSSVVVVKQVTG